VDKEACKYVLRKTHRLFCAHELAEYGKVNLPIPLDLIDKYWKKIDMSSSVPIDNEVVDDVRDR